MHQLNFRHRSSLSHLADPWWVIDAGLLMTSTDPITAGYPELIDRVNEGKDDVNR